MDIIHNKVNDIATLLLNHIANDEIFKVKGIGLYSGHAGIIFFLYHYFIFQKVNDRYKNIFDQYFCSFLDKLENGVDSYTYCSGLSGILAALKKMNDNGLINIDYSDLEKNYYDSILRFANYNIINNNYDFLHGAIGCSIYFYDDEYFAKNIIDGLIYSSVEEDTMIKWKSILNTDGDIGYNISLSHGISSVIIYLSLIYGKYSFQSKVKRLLNCAVSYILSQEVDRDQYGCCFPSQSLENKDKLYKSRLAWCYGDLGVAVALWQAGKATGNESWKQKAIDIFIYSSQRRKSENTKINEAGLCHGSSGVAMIFLYMYKETKNEIFKSTSDYWINKTIDFSMMFNDGFSGYKALSICQDEIVWVDSYNLLDGIAGIGLMLMASSNNVVADSLFKSMLLY